MATSTNLPLTTSGTGRGPAPPLPEKPPSVAERTRLLKSSFRREDGEKPKVSSPSPVAERATTLPHSYATNGDKSETPSPASSVGSMNGVGAKASTPDPVKDISPKPAVSPPATTNPSYLLEVQMTQRKRLHKVPSTLQLNAKRDAFFKSDGQSAPKFDPSARFNVDRERQDRIREPNLSKDDDREKEHHKERKHGDTGPKELEGYVGFANLPNQVFRKSVKKGFEFTLMVVGESGLGKSTLINSLFLSDLYSGDYPGPSHRIQKTVKVDTTQVVLKENGVQLKLTVVDTPGFGDAVDNSNCWQPVIDYIDSKYDEYLNSESRVNRTTMPDTRVHTCCYFIAPTGHGLKPLDVEFMKRLHDKVNIIPIIAKADTLTPDECREFKKTILNEIAQHKIKIYEFPECDDDEEKKLQKKLRDRVPFAVIGSNRVIESGGKKIRGRQYPWGIVEVENLEHNDFVALQSMLIRKHMQDLKDVTNNVHYENFRYNKLAPTSTDGNKIKPGSLSKDPLTQMAEEKRDHDIKMKKMEAEMEHVFETKVKEKEQKLKESEADLQRRSEHTKKSLEQQQKELDEKWVAFQREKKNWEEAMGISGSNENIKDSHKKEKKRLF